MSFSFGFYNSVDHDRLYDAVQMSMIFDGIINDGIYATVGKAMVLKVNSGKVVVQPGRAWFDHTWNYNDADLPLEAPASDLLLNRYDAVVLDIQSDTAHRKNSIMWVTGTPSSSPKKPTMIKTTYHKQYPLGYIYRGANTTAITQANIQNTVGTSECPFVTGIIDTISIDGLLLQWRDEWEQYTSQYEEAAEFWLEQKKDEYIKYFAELSSNSEEYYEEYLEKMRNLFNDLSSEGAYFYDTYLKDLQDYFERITGEGDEKYKGFSDELESYIKELEEHGNATIANIIKELLNFRDTNESRFLQWLKEKEAQLAQYPAGEILQQIAELEKDQEEILKMLYSGDIITRIFTEDGDYIMDDLGDPVLAGSRICKCNND